MDGGGTHVLGRRLAERSCLFNDEGVDAVIVICSSQFRSRPTQLGGASQAQWDLIYSPVRPP